MSQDKYSKEEKLEHYKIFDENVKIPGNERELHEFSEVCQKLMMLELKDAGFEGTFDDVKDLRIMSAAAYCIDLRGGDHNLLNNSTEFWDALAFMDMEAIDEFAKRSESSDDFVNALITYRTIVGDDYE